MIEHRVRVLTWNLWWRFGPHWRDRQPGIRSTLEQIDPDVVALQEVWTTPAATQADELAAALGFHAVTAGPSYPRAPADDGDPDHDGVDLGIAVLSRWPVLDVRTPALPARHRLGAGPELIEQRIDHVFFRPGREDQHVFVDGVRLAGDPVGGVFPSDHRAVVADLRWHDQRADA